MEMIEKKALMKSINETSERVEKDKPDGFEISLIILSAFKDFVDDTPTVDAEPVAHAHWIDNGYEPDEMATCSKCGEDFDTTEETFDLFKQYYRYCPCCGAKMDGAKVIEVNEDGE